jgi:hypothetical protein
MPGMTQQLGKLPRVVSRKELMSITGLTLAELRKLNRLLIRAPKSRDYLLRETLNSLLCHFGAINRSPIWIEAELADWTGE